MKKLLVALVLVTGCSTPGKINADAIADAVAEVTGRHDAYVTADPAVPADKKASFLRTSDLLRRVVAESQAAKNGPATKEPPK